jgi:hypothetical protein
LLASSSGIRSSLASSAAISDCVSGLRLFMSGV